MWMNGTPDKNDADEERAAITHFMTDFPLLNASFNRFYNSAPLVAVLSTLTRLLSQLGEEEELLDNIDSTPLDVRKMKLQSLIASWSILKKLGEESLASLISTVASKPVIREWRRAAEKIYHFMVAMFADGKNMGNGLSVVATDANCNGHITSNGSLERQVRLPAAVKGAKLAGAGCDGSMTRLITTIPARYIEYAETKILPKAHDVLYLKRMKTRCAAARTDDEVLVLTDDSDGEGGEDTGKRFFLKSKSLYFI
jgi:cytidylate kinase